MNDFTNKTDKEQQEAFKSLVREGKGAEADKLATTDRQYTPEQVNGIRLSNEIEGLDKQV